jgi:uncharacterized membrane protein
MEAQWVEDPRIESARRVAFICYALYALSFLVGVTAIAAIILGYIKREDARGTWVESHYRWQIRTFWIALVGTVVFWILSLVLIGIPFLIALYIWAIYRVVKGWLRLYERRPVTTESML